MLDVKTIMERIPTVARLYYTGLGSRRYKRASTQDGPGEPLVHRSHVEREIARLLAERANGVVVDGHQGFSLQTPMDSGNPNE